MPIAAGSGWTSEQKHVVAASFLGWALDAFDFFLMVFVLTDIAKEFNSDVTDVTVAILLTLAMRPIGAFLFGACRRPLRAAANPDGQHRALFGAGIRFRLRAKPDGPAYSSVRYTASPWAANGASAPR